MLENLKDLERGIKEAQGKDEKDMFIELLKDDIKEADGNVDAETQKFIDKLKEMYLGAKKKATPKAEKKPSPKTTKKPKAKSTPEEKAERKRKINEATGKTIEECKEILAKYEALRGKTTQKDKQRVEKLKDEDKIIDGTNVKTADATTETTTKQIPKKIKQEVDAIEKEAEKEAIEQVKKESKKFYLAFFNKKKLEIEADSLLDAKKKAIKEFSVPKSKMGLLAVKLASNQDVKIEEVKKKEIEEVKIEKIEEKVKDMTKDLAEKSNELIDAMTNTIKKLSPSKEEAIKFLMDIRNHIDALLKSNKFEFGGAVQSYDIAWAGGGRPMPMFERGGEIPSSMRAIESILKDSGFNRHKGSPKNELKHNRGKHIAVITDGKVYMTTYTPNTKRYLDSTILSSMKEVREYLDNSNLYAKGGKFADGGMENIYRQTYTYLEYVIVGDYPETLYTVTIGINEDENFGGEFIDRYGEITINEIKEIFGNEIAQRVANGYGRDYEDGDYRSKVIFVNDGLYKKGGKLPRKKGLGWKRDRERLSQEPHEQAYKSKRKGDYSSFERGGYYGGDGEEWIYPSEEERIDTMVDHWNKQGWAQSSVSKQGDDGEFFDRIGVDSMKVGITSQTGNDIIYYDVNRPSYFNRGFAKGGKIAQIDEILSSTDDSKKYRKLADIRKKLLHKIRLNDNDVKYLEDNGIDTYSFAKGGRTTRGYHQDRARLSKEKHEQAYLPKRKGDYSSFSKGGEILNAIAEDWGRNSDVYYAVQNSYVFFDSDEKAKKVLENYDVLEDYEHIFNEDKYAKGGEVKEEYKEFFKRYEENEDNNAHLDNAIMLVSEFGTADELKRLMEIQQMHEKQGYLTVEQSREQYEIQKPYYRKMFAKGGKTWVQDVVDSPNFREGAFKRKAEARGMSTDAFMNQVLHSPHLYDERTRKQAQFMKNAFND